MLEKWVDQIKNWPSFYETQKQIDREKYYR